MPHGMMEESYEPSSSEKYNGKGSDEDDGGGEFDEFASAMADAMPEHDWTPERLDAMKEAIRICMESDYEDSKTKPDDKAGLALIFGPPGKESSKKK